MILGHVMKYGVKILLRMIVVCVLIGTYASISSATVALPATIESLTKQADLVVHVLIEKQWVPQKRGPRGEIYTYSQLKLLDVWQGEVKQPLVLIQLGGELDGLRLEVHGDAQMKVGDEVVLFLSTSQRSVYSSSTSSEVDQSGVTVRGTSRQTIAQAVHLVSLAQGAFFIERNATGEERVSQRLDDLTFYPTYPMSKSIDVKGEVSTPLTFQSLSSLKREVSR